jgi:hypothetical protein
MNNTYHTYILPPLIHRIRAIEMIVEEKKKTSHVLLIDVRNYPRILTRDFFIALSQKLHKDDIHFLVHSPEEQMICRSFGFFADLPKKEIHI